MKEVSFRNDVLPLKNILFRLALRITTNREEAEDVVQDTLMKVWDRREDWAEIESMEAYALSICRNLALDCTKKKGRRDASLDEEGARQAVSHANPYEQAAQSNRVRIVRQLIDSLPEKQRSCIQLRDFEGKTYKEIAAALDMTDEQVKINIFRARQTIKQRFTQIDGYGL